MIAPIVSGLVIYKFIDYQQLSNLKRLGRGVFVDITIFLILVVGILSIFSVYRSPRTVMGNWQRTGMEIAGTEWLIRHQDNNIVVASLTIQLRRFEDLIYGTESVPTRTKLDMEPMLSHFGYDENKSVAQSYDFTNRYLLTCEADRLYPMIYPQNVRSRAHQYLDEDFARLRADPTVAQLYANGEFEVWRVYGK